MGGPRAWDLQGLRRRVAAGAPKVDDSRHLERSSYDGRRAWHWYLQSGKPFLATEMDDARTALCRTKGEAEDEDCGSGELRNSCDNEFRSPHFAMSPKAIDEQDRSGYVRRRMGTAYGTAELFA